MRAGTNAFASGTPRKQALGVGSFTKCTWDGRAGSAMFPREPVWEATTPPANITA
jgi:hypothetical protein